MIVSKNGSLFFTYFIFCYFCVSLTLYINGEYNVNYLFIVFDLIIFIRLIFFLFMEKGYFRLDLVFYILFPFYFKLSCFLFLFYTVSVIDISPEGMAESYAFANSVWLFGILIFFIRPKFCSYGDIAMSSVFFSLSRTYKSLLLPFSISMLVSLMFLYQIKDVLFIDRSSFSRLDIVNEVGQTGWYLKYIIISYAWVVIIYRNSKLITFPKFCFFLIPVVLYSYSQLIIGSRRELIFILLFFAISKIVKSGGRISLRMVVLLLLTAFLFIVVGVGRSATDSGVTTLLVNSFGEFLFPISTFQYYLSSGYSDFQFGLTYIYSLFNFVPKEIIPNKPLPLAMDFALMMAEPGAKTIMGYAFTPLSEAYVNFGKISILSFPLLLSFISLCIEFFFKRSFIIHFLMLSQCLNFQRSDISSIFFETVMLLSCTYILICVSSSYNKRLADGKLLLT